MERIILNDGNFIPSVGFGVFLIPNDGSTYRAVRAALDAGYRHIDTAAAYFNEREVGRAVKDSGIPRDEIFITSKLWLQDYGYEPAKKGLEQSLKKLGTDYIDLYLLHQPYGDVINAWKALEDGQKDGKIRSVGVSNMTPKIWKEFVPHFDIMPAVNQVECNPYFQQRELRKILDANNVKIEAWGPLGQGNHKLLSDPNIVRLAQKYGKNAGQIILRFEVQDGVIVLPKSTNLGRMKSNLDIFDFSLADEEMSLLRSLDTRKGSHDPDAPGVGEWLLANYNVHIND
ncbi:MAG: aldo/keto reductase [Christensenellales bacterium]